jgi:hypothetical protein
VVETKVAYDLEPFKAGRRKVFRRLAFFRRERGGSVGSRGKSADKRLDFRRSSAKTDRETGGAMTPPTG